MNLHRNDLGPGADEASHTCRDREFDPIGIHRRASAAKKSLPRPRSVVLVATLVAGALTGAASRGFGAEALRWSGTTMGTQYSVQVAWAPRGLDEAALRADVDAVLTRVDRRMSTYRGDSEISRFNASRSTEWIGVSSETAAVVAEALAVARLSGGAFDVTVAPLVELWGFGPTPRRGQKPPRSAIEQALARVGSTRLEVRSAPPALRKTTAEPAIDLSAIAKGFAVDAVAHALRRRGVDHFLIEVGGELRGGGQNNDGEEWRVAIQTAEDTPSRAAAAIRLADAAVATSGNYRTYFDADGRRYSHLIDPRSGEPVTHDLVLVSVIARTAMRADALATALFVLGPDDGWKLAERQGLAALFVRRSGETRRTATFAAQEIR